MYSRPPAAAASPNAKAAVIIIFADLAIVQSAPSFQADWTFVGFRGGRRLDDPAG